MKTKRNLMVLWPAEFGKSKPVKKEDWHSGTILYAPQFVFDAPLIEKGYGIRSYVWLN